MLSVSHGLKLNYCFLFKTIANEAVPLEDFTYIQPKLMPSTTELWRFQKKLEELAKRVRGVKRVKKM